MDANSRRGAKVVFAHPEKATNYHDQFLTDGEIYTVEHLYTSNRDSGVYLQEKPGIIFPLEIFDNVKE